MFRHGVHAVSEIKSSLRHWLWDRRSCNCFLCTRLLQ